MQTRTLVGTALAVALMSGCAATRDAADSVADTSREVAGDVADAEIWDTIGDNWDQLKTSASSRWDRLTSDDLDDIDGDREELIEDVADYYDISEEEAARQVDTWAVTQG